MNLTAVQVREASSLLNWRSPALIRRAKISFESARKARTEDGLATLPFMEVWAIRAAFERAGVRFVLDTEGRPGVELEPRAK